MNPLKQLHDLGQSVWLDCIRRNMFASGELKRLVTEDGIMGVISNPAIFEKAIAGSTDYRDAILAFSGRGDVDATLAEARRLWAMVARPNIMVTVPATAEGLP
jgi:transaldolase